MSRIEKVYTGFRGTDRHDQARVVIFLETNGENGGEPRNRKKNAFEE